MGELLQEIRVAQTGTQILFAFLLGVPFTQRFEQITSFQRTVYYATLLSAAVASVFLIAPSAYHRINFRSEDKERLLLVSNRWAILGLAALSVAIIPILVLYICAVAVITIIFIFILLTSLRVLSIVFIITVEHGCLCFL